MKIKSGLLYTKTHEWVQLAGGTARVGITAYIPESMGKISFLNLCDEGERYDAGDIIGDAEAFKGVVDICTPVGGTVVSVNDELLDEPERINGDPYGSWLAELGNVRLTQKLLTDEEYRLFVGNDAEITE